jgi:L-ribulose-5-phosphate 3-epimerase
MSNKSRLRYSISAQFLAPGRSYLERFELAAEAGFEGIELNTVADRDEVQLVGEAAKAVGITIHSVRTNSNWEHPLSGEDPHDVSISVRANLQALENARCWGADTLLLIPGVVTSAVSPAQAYANSQRVIRSEILPAAEELGIVIAVENAWNGFLLTPTEYVRYIDEFESKWIRAYLDVGNVMFGHPEHWIRIAGSRIAKLHVKDFHLDLMRGRFSIDRLGQGAIKWDVIREALAQVGFSGWATNTEPIGVLARGGNFAARKLRGNPLARLPGVAPALWSVQRYFSRRWLRGAALRCDRFLG